MSVHPSVIAFDRFYNENKNKLHMKTTHPINNKALQEWQTSLEDNADGVRMLGRLIGIGLTHISFKHFLGVLRKAALEVVFLCEREQRKIILFIDDNYLKSNTWVALLVWPLIKHHVIFVSHEITIELLQAINNENLVVVHVDDGSFSGTQIVLTLTNQVMNYVGHNQDHVKWFILVASLSQTAKTRILTDGSEFVLFPNNVITFDNIGEQARSLMGDEFWLFELTMKDKAYEDIYMASNLVHTIYFDYKLPDALSTIQKIIAIAPDIDTSTNKITTRSLIVGCSPSDYKSDGLPLNPSKPYVDFDDNATCPIAFYKTIQYTWEGQLLRDGSDPKELLSYLLSTTVGCSICKQHAAFY